MMETDTPQNDPFPGEVWSATMNLRFVKGRLQQEFVSDYGRRQWREVPEAES